MSYEQKDNSGSLFKNSRKEKDTHPDYTGSALINGVPMWLSAWIKRDKNGNAYMSCSFKPKDENAMAGLRDDLSKLQQRGGRDPISDDIPFSMEWR